MQIGNIPRLQRYFDVVKGSVTCTSMARGTLGGNPSRVALILWNVNANDVLASISSSVGVMDGILLAFGERPTRFYWPRDPVLTNMQWYFTTAAPTARIEYIEIVERLVT